MLSPDVATMGRRLAVLWQLGGDSAELTTIPSRFTLIPGSAIAFSMATFVPFTVSSGMMRH